MQRVPFILRRGVCAFLKKETGEITFSLGKNVLPPQNQCSRSLFLKSQLYQSLGMSGVFIEHLGLGQAQDGTPIGPQHVSLLYLQALEKLVLPRESLIPRGVVSYPSPQEIP
ncbi:hypothetical protein RHMOL_Rhmol01G0165400 [Rhododendron molle]|uniref:Uncharacterized protein n=1 Tax=Rhododendron molle TaxID=49168 RepID=A0ACC0Q4V2_RHOML|nr:hypothetical protein RHMOL_Rhmol01G0165400 [Rhododendron molle]